MKPVGGGSGELFCDHGWFSWENPAEAAKNRTMAARKSLVFTGKDLIFIKREFIMPNQSSSTSESTPMFALSTFCLNDVCTKDAHRGSDRWVRLGEFEQFGGIRFG